MKFHGFFHGNGPVRSFPHGKNSSRLCTVFTKELVMIISNYSPSVKRRRNEMTVVVVDANKKIRQAKLAPLFPLSTTQKSVRRASFHSHSFQLHSSKKVKPLEPSVARRRCNIFISLIPFHAAQPKAGQTPSGKNGGCGR